MKEASKVDMYMLRSIDAGHVVGTCQVGCTKAVLPAFRERQVVAEFLTCAACRGLPRWLDKETCSESVRREVEKGVIH